MRTITFFITLSVLLLLVGCHGCFNSISEEMLMQDQNPELISYLQGDWTQTNDKNHVIRIKRDSIYELYNDAIIKAHSLSYSFNGFAGKYFTKDSSFEFPSVVVHGPESNEFKLMEINKDVHDTITHFLIYVSKSRMDINSANKIVRFNKRK